MTLSEQYRDTLDQARDSVVEVRQVYRTFERETAPIRALRGADLEVGHGEFVAVMGPSGCGKSTLLNIIAGLDVADEGEVSVAGESIIGRSESELAIMRRRHIGIVFQFFNLLEGMTALEFAQKNKQTHLEKILRCAESLKAGETFRQRCE